MGRRAALKPYFRKARARDGLAPWCVSVPANLSERGKREQLFYPTQEAAQTICEKYKARRDNFGASLNALTPARMLEAAQAFDLLKPTGAKLLDVVRDFVEADRRRKASIPFGQLFDQFIKSRHGSNEKYLAELKITKKRMQDFHEMLVSDITHEVLWPFLEPISPGGRRAVMRYLSTIFNFAIRHKYISENPIKRLDMPKRQSREVETVPVEQVRRMLEHAIELI